MKTIIKNPTNQYAEEISEHAWLWYFLFGSFYFFYKGATQIAIYSLLINVGMLVGFSAAPGNKEEAGVVVLFCLINHIILSIFAKGSIHKYYLRRGWSKMRLPDLPSH